MSSVSGVKESVSRAFRDPRTMILFNRKTAEVVGTFQAGKILPADKLGEDAQVIALNTKKPGKVTVLSKTWVGRSAMMAAGFCFFPFKITNLEALPPSIAEAISDLLRKTELTLDTSPEE